MFEEWFFCAIQVSLVAIIAWLLSRPILNRFPDLSATVCSTGIAVGMILVLTTLFGLPRIWQMQWPAETLPSTATSSPDSVEVCRTDPVPADRTEKSEVQKPAGALVGIDLIQFAWKLKTGTNRALQDGAGAFVWFWRIAAGMSILLLLRFVIGLYAISKLNRESRIAGCEVTNAILRKLCRQMGLSREIQLRVHDSIDSPCVSWLESGTIFVPPGFEQWTRDETNAALAHELAHIVRRDPLSRMGSEIAWAFLYWNPFMFLIRSQQTLARELAADQKAVLALGDPFQYSRGLSRLALRLDAGLRRKPFFPGVSISSSCLIRRIKMLKGFHINKRPLARVWRGLFATTSLALFAWIGCWSLGPTSAAAQQTQQEGVRPEGERTARAESTASAGSTTTSARAPFALAVSQPWNELGGQVGYFSIRVSELAGHVRIGRHLDELANYAEVFRANPDGTRPTLADFGLNPESITRIDGSLQMQAARKTEQESEEENASGSLTIGSGRTSIITESDINWTDLIRALDFESMTNADDAKKYRERMAGDAKTGKSYMAPGLGETETEFPMPDLRQQSMWNSVSGGVVTVFTTKDEVSMQELLSLSSDPGLNEGPVHRLSREINSLAIGMDLESLSSEQALLRIAVEPTEGVTAAELLTSLKETREYLVTLFNADWGDEQADGTVRGYIAQNLRDSKIEISGSDDDAFVFISGQFDWSPMFKTSVVEDGEVKPVNDPVIRR